MKLKKEPQYVHNKGGQNIIDLCLLFTLSAWTP